MHTEVILHDPAGGDVDADLFAPDSSERPVPAIVLIPEMYGINAYLHDVARSFAAAGFYVLAIDVLWKISPRFALEYTGPDNARAHQIHDEYDLEGSMSAMQAAVDYVRGLDGVDGKVGIVGFCLGGTLAYLAAVRTNVDAAVGYYGSRIVELLDLAPKVRVPVLLHFGAEDQALPVADLERILTGTASNPQFTNVVHPGAAHAFANHVRADRFHPAATEAAQRQTLEFFRRHLGVAR